jgi:hypothetical protein
MERCIGGYELSETKHSRAGWPKQKEVHSPENRTGQAWKEDEAWVFNNEKFVARKRPIDHFTCKCKAVVRLDSHGNAVCEECGKIYNDQVEVVIIAPKSKITTRSFIYKAFHKVE